MMINSSEDRPPFIEFLLKFAQAGKEDRGALANLRSGLGKKPGEMGRVHKYVVPFLSKAERYNDQWYYLIATLFGMHPRHKDPIVHEKNGGRWTEVWTVGRAFRELKKKSDNMEARFIALLNAHPEDVGTHLRHIASLLKNNDVPLDWCRLFKDLCNWDHPDRFVQLQWARDFYAETSNDDAMEAEPQPDDTNAQEGNDNE